MKKLNKFIFVLLSVCSMNAFAYPVTGEMPEKLKTFAENLESVSATFIKFVKNVGFTWHQEKPSKEVFTSTLTTYCVNGETKELNELPYFYRIQSMIDKMLNGDMSDFLFAFNVDYSEYKNTWTLVATPRLTNIADIIQNLTMYGSTTDLTKVVMTYDDGTIVILEFNRSKKDFADEIIC